MIWAAQAPPGVGRHALVPALVLAAALVPLTVLPTAPATAEIKTFTDPAHDSGGLHSDIGRVVVQHAPTFVRVAMFPPASRPNAVTGTDSVTDVWIDTDATRPGPEWLVLIAWDGETTSVYRAFRDAKGFHATGPRVCRITTTRYRPNAAGTTQVVAPRACLGRPPRLRVNVTLTTELTLFPTEYAPGKQRFGPWVAAG